MIAISDLPATFVSFLIGFWKRRWYIVLLTWVFVLLGWGALALIPDTYESRAQINLNTDTYLRSIINREGTDKDLEKRISVMRRQLLSRENMEKLIAETSIGDELLSEAEVSRAVSSLQEGISVENQEGQYFVIKYGNQDPKVAQLVVAKLVNMFIEQDIGAGIMQSQDAVEKVDAEIARLEKVLQEKDAELTAFRQKHARELAGTERVGREIDLLEDNLSRLRGAEFDAIRNRDEFRMLLTKTPRAGASEELGQLKLRLLELQSQYNDNYPDIVALKTRIAEIENSRSIPANQEYTRLEVALQSAEAEILDLRNRARNVQSQINELTLVSSQQPAVQAELAELVRRYDQVEKSYIGLLSEQNNLALTANLSAGGGTIDYNIFEAPVVAAEPIFPPRGLMTLGITVLAIGGAFSIIFFILIFDRTYTQATEIEKSLELPVLGSISPADAPIGAKKRKQERLLLAGAAASVFAVAIFLFWYQAIRVPSQSGQQEIVQDNSPTKSKTLRGLGG